MRKLGTSMTMLRALNGGKEFVASTILTGTLKVATTGSGEFVNITLTK